MGIKQDVFGLEQIYRLQVEGQWSTRGDVWKVRVLLDPRWNNQILLMVTLVVKIDLILIQIH